MPATASSVKSIRTATMDDVPAIARVLGRAFYGDPLFRWFFPGTRPAWRVPSGCAPSPRVSISFPTVRPTSSRPMRTGAGWCAAPACGSLPATTPRRNATMLRSLPHLASMLGVRHLPRVMRYIADLKGSVPEEPHWHLRAMGTDPAARGTGVGFEPAARPDSPGRHRRGPGVPVHDEPGQHRLLRAVRLPRRPSRQRPGLPLHLLHAPPLRLTPVRDRPGPWHRAPDTEQDTGPLRRSKE